MRLDDYFARIAYSGSSRPTTEVLTRLLEAHVLHVPFENLDVQLGRPISTDPAAAYDKIVTRRRGGWCYEQNGLFGWALSEIGFGVTRVAAAVLRDERGAAANSSHLCLLVDSADHSDPWLVDVGFGGSMLTPIELRAATHRQAPFRIGLRRTSDGYWRFWEDLGDGEFSYDFVPESADEPALATKCADLQTRPDSGFVQNLVAQIRSPTAHTTLRGKVLRRASDDGIETRNIGSPGELVTVLRDTFTLYVPEVAELWPRIERRHEEVMQQDAPV